LQIWSAESIFHIFSGKNLNSTVILEFSLFFYVITTVSMFNTIPTARADFTAIKIINKEHIEHNGAFFKFCRLSILFIKVYCVKHLRNLQIWSAESIFHIFSGKNLNSTVILGFSLFFYVITTVSMFNTIPTARADFTAIKIINKEHIEHNGVFFKFCRLSILFMEQNKHFNFYFATEWVLNICAICKYDQQKVSFLVKT
jgi:hypothetical protein